MCIIVYLERTGVLSDTRLAHLFLALLEAAEVVLNEERGVELADRHVVALRCSHTSTGQYILTATRLLRTPQQLYKPTHSTAVKTETPDKLSVCLSVTT